MLSISGNIKIFVMETNSTNAVNALSLTCHPICPLSLTYLSKYVLD